MPSDGVRAACVGFGKSPMQLSRPGYLRRAGRRKRIAAQHRCRLGFATHCAAARPRSLCEQSGHGIVASTTWRAGANSSHRRRRFKWLKSTLRPIAPTPQLDGPVDLRSGSANSLRMRWGCRRITDQLTQLIEAGPTKTRLFLTTALLQFDGMGKSRSIDQRPGLGSSGKGARVRDAGVGGHRGLRIPGGNCAHASLPRRGDILSHLGQPPGDGEPN